MSFINKCSTIIRRSSKDMFNFYLDEKLVYDYFDKESNLIYSTPLIDSYIDFTNSYFTLDKDDSLYGIYIDNALKLFEIPKNSNNFTKRDILTYNYKKFNVLFPYIKKFNDDIHILYYVHNNNANNTCALFHHYNHNGVWTENKIDFINHIVLNDFVVLWVQQSPIVFYFNLVDGYEEVFLSRFNYNTLTWSNPTQITNSKKNKIYLSVLKDSMNFYHLTFCENIDNGYAVKYINGYLMDNKLDVNISTYITSPSTCMYPSLIKNKSYLYLMWVNYGKLNTSLSTDLGKTWSEHEVDEFSIEEDFTRARFISNYKDDLSYNVTSVFTTCDDVGILGF
ncbi:hypothetical protein [Romboutsia sp.]|uniref:hypothetical protein n=1 Tax=Romboutsia sp. TaxID=1965302 RepID=UPI002CA495BC|nr:hypothetical protein [Romboutsia sp.]HSQ88156.1 hypothetical protein [Romboutsia sp.]